MGKIIAISVFLGIFTSFVFSQNGEHDGGRFVKKIEYNKLMFGNAYNLDSKKYVTKLFFGDFNAPIEYYYTPADGPDKPPAGFRIIQDSLSTSWILEVKYILNYEEVSKRVKEKYPIVDSALTMDQLRAKKSEYRLKHYDIGTLSYPISNQFAEKLYEKTVSFIDNFKAKGVVGITIHSHSVIFRTVVDDEVWMLYIHMPTGDASKMADICEQIVKDAENNELAEAKYLQLLDF